MGKRSYPGAVHGKQLKSIREFRQADACLVMFFEAIDRTMRRVAAFDYLDHAFPEYEYPIQERNSWCKEARDYVKTVAWLQSLDETDRNAASRVQVVGDLHDKVFTHYRQLPPLDSPESPENSRAREIHRANLQHWARSYGLAEWDEAEKFVTIADGRKIPRWRSSAKDRFFDWVECLLMAWKRCESSGKDWDSASRESRDLAGKAKSQFVWGPFFRRALGEEELARSDLLLQKDAVVESVPYDGPLPVDQAHLRDKFRRRLYEKGTGPTGPLYKAIEDHPRFEKDSSPADWIKQLTKYADRVERVARSVGIMQAGGWDRLPRDFEWLVRRAVYRESPGRIADAEDRAEATPKITEAAVQKAIGRAAKLIGLKLRKGRPHKRQT